MKKSHYTCHSDNKGTPPRVTTHKAVTHTEEGVGTKTILTEWKDIPCGHITSQHDAYCTGCTSRGYHDV